MTLGSQIAHVSLNNNKIHLESGTSCVFSDQNCIDLAGGYTFWRLLPSETCNFDQYTLLYQGYADQVVDKSTDPQIVMFSVATNEMTFALSIRGKTALCGHVLEITEHPKLFIFRTAPDNGLFTNKKQKEVSNLDIFAYVNSKFVYVERHIRTQMDLLYRDVLLQKCKLERQTMKNSLSIATQAPDEFAYDLMKGPGYMAVAAGEVVHIIKCIPVDVRVKQNDVCYAELRVERNNNTFFMTPRTHILKSQGTIIQCNTVLPVYYYIDNQWYRMLPKPTIAISPEVLKPMTTPTWTYSNPADLATSGIYTENDLEHLRERIMFPVESNSLINDLARDIRGHTDINNQGSILKLLNEEAVEHIISSSWDRLWSKFLTFGTVSAGIIAILMILHAIKTLIDVAIQGYALHSVYGWSLHMLGAIWGSVTYLLLHLGRKRSDTDTYDVEKAELQEIDPLSPSSTINPAISQDNPATEKKSKRSSGFFTLQT